MKVFLVILTALLLPIASTVNAQVSAEDTKTYIKTNLANQYLWTKFQVSFDGTKMTLEQSLKYVANGTITWEPTTYVVDLSNLDPASVEVWDYKVAGQGVMGKSIHFRTSDGSKRIDSSRSGAVSEFSLSYFNDDLAARLANAFAHLISLSGGKPDPFKAAPANPESK
ncbi:MAG: hypothetical protein ACAI37_06470 [Chthoniobacter sp.]